MTDNQIFGPVKAFKSAGDFIIELGINTDKPHNLDREVIDKNYAKYRCKEAIVFEIRQKDSPYERIQSIKSDYDEHFVYKVGEIITADDYNSSDGVCVSGIHFYLSHEAAYFHNKEDFLPSKLFVQKTWSHSGDLIKTSTYKDKLLDGLCVSYNRGKICAERNYKNNKLEGISKCYHNNILTHERFYENNRIVWDKEYKDGQLIQTNNHITTGLSGPSVPIINYNPQPIINYNLPQVIYYQPINNFTLPQVIYYPWPPVRPVYYFK
jgi:hypothetical protein